LTPELPPEAEQELEPETAAVGILTAGAHVIPTLEPEAPAKRTGKTMGRIWVQKANRKDKPASRIKARKVY
jgi:hypothetical protein